MCNEQQKNICTVDDCGRRIEARGLCERHYKQWQVHGEVLKIQRSLKAPNKFIEYDSYIEVVLFNKMGVECARAKVDKEMNDLVKGTKWSYHPTGYAFGRVDGRPVFMHRHILRGYAMLDHINGDKLDNRLKNLRGATNRQNAQNSKMPSNNTTGYKGVTKIRGKYMALINNNGKRVNLGCFKCPHEAALAYDRGAVKFFGEYARTNFHTTEDGDNHDL